jgi:trehalose 6-phosphate synthase
VVRIKVPDLEMFRPLAREVATFAESLNVARSAAALEARLRETGESMWTADRLAVHVRARLEDGRLFVVSNREPYMHVRRGKAVEVNVPASGLVTAMEPVLRACDGTWVAHGSGDADLEMVDAHDRLLVPPDDPRYVLRRIWLTKEEEEGYYYGFANEGLWPLCHIAHTRPLFRASDWKHYQEVNRKFADALIEEMENIRRPVVLVQDYHFALLPRMIKQARRSRRYLLAHPVAESGGFRDLPLAAGTGGRVARRRPCRVPHSGALHQLPANRRPDRRITHRLGALLRAAP